MYFLKMTDDTVVEQGAVWNSIEEGWLAILQWAVNEDLLYNVTHADKQR